MHKSDIKINYDCHTSLNAEAWTIEDKSASSKTPALTQIPASEPTALSAADGCIHSVYYLVHHLEPNSLNIYSRHSLAKPRRLLHLSLIPDLKPARVPFIKEIFEPESLLLLQTMSRK